MSEHIRHLRYEVIEGTEEESEEEIEEPQSIYNCTSFAQESTQSTDPSMSLIGDVAYQHKPG